MSVDTQMPVDDPEGQGVPEVPAEGSDASTAPLEGSNAPLDSEEDDTVSPEAGASAAGGITLDEIPPEQLPPDPEGTNDASAQAALGMSLQEYAAGMAADEGVTHHLTDLMHLCDRAGVDFALSLSNARQHYDAETQEAPGEQEDDTDPTAEVEE